MTDRDQLLGQQCCRVGQGSPCHAIAAGQARPEEPASRQAGRICPIWPPASTPWFSLVRFFSFLAFACRLASGWLRFLWLPFWRIQALRPARPDAAGLGRDWVWPDDSESKDRLSRIRDIATDGRPALINTWAVATKL